MSMNIIEGEGVAVLCIVYTGFDYGDSTDYDYRTLNFISPSSNRLDFVCHRGSGWYL